MLFLFDKICSSVLDDHITSYQFLPYYDISKKVLNLNFFLDIHIYNNLYFVHIPNNIFSLS